MVTRPRKVVRLLPKSVLSLGIVSFLNDAASEMIYPLLPIFLTQVLGLSVGFLGLIEGVAESASAILKYFSGLLADRVRRYKLPVIVGYTMAVVLRPLLAFTTAGWQVLVLRFTDRVGKGIRTAPRDALIAGAVGEGERGKAFGFHRAMDHTGAMVGPLLASGLLWLFRDTLAMNQAVSLRLIFLLALLPGVLSLFVIALGVKEPEKLSVKEIKKKGSVKKIRRETKFFVMIIIIFTLGNSSDAFLILRATQFGMAPWAIPLLWSFHSFVKAVSSTPCGILSDKIGRKPLLLVAYVLYAIIYLGFAFGGGLWAVWALFAFYGFFYGMTEGVEKALIGDLTPFPLRGTAFGLYNMAVGITALPASLLFGLLWQFYSPQIAFVFGSSLSLLAAFLLLFLKVSLQQRPSS